MAEKSIKVKDAYPPQKLKNQQSQLLQVVSERRHHTDFKMVLKITYDYRLFKRLQKCCLQNDILV